jgi:hypothetical protein
MKFKSGSMFIYAGGDAMYSHLEFIGYEGRGSNYFKQKIYYQDGVDPAISIGHIGGFLMNIENGIWVPATPLMLELL